MFSKSSNINKAQKKYIKNNEKHTLFPRFANMMNKNKKERLVSEIGMMMTAAAVLKTLAGGVV